MMKERKINILVMAETRHWGRDEGRDLGGGYTLMYCEQKREEEDME